MLKNIKIILKQFILNDETICIKIINLFKIWIYLNFNKLLESSKIILKFHEKLSNKLKFEKNI